jgi:hypothetical protein
VPRLSVVRVLRGGPYPLATIVTRIRWATLTDGRPGHEAVEVSEIEITTRLATASVTFEGGINDGQRASVTLVKELKDWRLYSLDQVEIDRRRFEAAIRRNLIAERLGVTT